MVVYTRQQHVLRSIEGYWRHFYVSEKEAGIVEQKKNEEETEAKGEICEERREKVWTNQRVEQPTQ